MRVVEIGSWTPGLPLSIVVYRECPVLDLVPFSIKGADCFSFARQYSMACCIGEGFVSAMRQGSQSKQ